MAESLAFWDDIASDWDRAIGDAGNDYWTHLQEPVLRRMVGSVAGQQAVDLATGNGIVARWLAREGANVLGTDGSQKMVGLAAARTFVGEATTGTARFQKLDLLNEDEVDDFALAQSRLLANGVDVITVNMAVMDISDLQPLAKLAASILKPASGRLVVTLLHPLFFTNNATRTLEVEEDANGRRFTVRAIKVKEYLDVAPHKTGLYLPKPSTSDSQTVFHRPLHALLAPFLAAGLVLDALEEPNFDTSLVDEARPLGSKNFDQIPKLLAFRLRRIA